ncbi:MAG: thioredoxin domain-containing protein [Candidatus Saccharibacteria bacterium]|nr:thioredoxin domain-containing protein [Candidatus Saccharibacteria bacterium]
MKKTFRIIGLITVIAVIIAAIVASMNIKPSNADKVWDTQMTIGNLEAKNYFIVYSDLVCPYCIAFENAIVEHEEEFQQYLEDNDILFEIRLSDFLYEYGETNPIHSRYSALGAYCAKNEGKFWDYYNLAVSSVWNDFFKASGKSAVSKMSSIGKDYWINIGKQVGLSEDFETCIKNEDTLNEIKANAEKTSKLARGMPYFKFNDYTSSGFDLSWDYQYVLMYFQAGLDSK